MKKKNKRKIFFLSPFLLATLALFMTSCEKTEKCTFCNVENPLTDLDWLKKNGGRNDRICRTL